MSLEAIKAALASNNYHGASYLLIEAFNSDEDTPEEIFRQLLSYNDLPILALFMRIYGHLPEFSELVIKYAQTIAQKNSSELVLLTITNLDYDKLANIAIIALAYYWQQFTGDPIIWQLYAPYINLFEVEQTADYLNNQEIVEQYVLMASPEEQAEYVSGYPGELEFF